MRERSRDKERLCHMLDAIQVIQDGVTTYAKEDLLGKPLLYYGLVKQVEIIGEAANMLTQEFRDEHPDTNWRPIVNMRHVLVHDYIHINPVMLWETIEHNLPDLKTSLERYIQEETINNNNYN